MLSRKVLKEEVNALIVYSLVLTPIHQEHSLYIFQCNVRLLLVNKLSHRISFVSMIFSSFNLHNHSPRQSLSLKEERTTYIVSLCENCNKILILFCNVESG